MMSLLANAGAYARGLEGWRRLAFAWVAGLASALGFAPFGAFPFLLLGYAALVLLIDGAQLRPRPIRASALAGFAFGFGQFLLGLHWIGFAFMVEPGAHAWQIPFVAVLFPGGLAMFIALACAASAVLWRPEASRIFVFTVFMSLAEWARGHLLTGFPWNIAAYGWGALLGVLQSAALFGAYGLTLLTILFGASLAEFFGTPPRRLFPSILTALFVVLWIGGEMRLAATPTVDVPDVRLRLVQPNIAQADKINRELISRNWREIVDSQPAARFAFPHHHRLAGGRAGAFSSDARNGRAGRYRSADRAQNCPNDGRIARRTRRAGCASPLQQFLYFRLWRRTACDLRQIPSGPFWRVSAVRGNTRSAGPQQAHRHQRQFRARRWSAYIRCTRCARRRSADLLRDFVSRRSDGRPAARLVRQCHG